MGRISDARERLINSAIELISTRSYNAVGVQELCEYAGVKKGSFYHFFPSKRDLTLTALDVIWETFRDKVLEPTLSSDLPPMEKFSRLLDISYQRSCTAKEATGCMTGCHLGNLALELSTQDEPIRQKIEHIFQKWEGYCERIIKEAVSEGQLPAEIDSQATAQAVLAYMEGILLLGKTYNDPTLIKRLGHGVLHLAICGKGLETNMKKGCND